ncbi:MAG: cold-shock protein [Spirosomataceae bacterium]|jgi:CspA family cold shock protein|nr:cold shock domain-containing protein [Flectobacillus sp.]
MQTGKVKFFNESKGFGFIVDDATSQEIFVHVTGLGGITIRENDLVSFETIDGKKGLNAVKVQKL